MESNADTNHMRHLHKMEKYIHQYIVTHLKEYRISLEEEMAQESAPSVLKALAFQNLAVICDIFHLTIGDKEEVLGDSDTVDFLDIDL